MAQAKFGQKLQDWITQQWVIARGRKINSKEHDWLLGPFGEPTLIGEEFISDLAKKENLTINRNAINRGLIPSIDSLELEKTALDRLSKDVIQFYEETANYSLDFKVKWNPTFKFSGFLLRKLFSERLNQLNIPTKDTSNEPLTSEIITLTDLEKIVYTFWYRSIKSSGQTVYSGIYGTCKLPSGQTCIKAIFPLPNGNATVIMQPSVGKNGELQLNSAGKKFGEAGFYFLLKDSKGNNWSHFVRSFHDKLIVSSENGVIKAEQRLSLYNRNVLQFDYEIRKN